MKLEFDFFSSSSQFRRNQSKRQEGSPLWQIDKAHNSDSVRLAEFFLSKEKCPRSAQGLLGRLQKRPGAGLLRQQTVESGALQDQGQTAGEKECMISLPAKILD